MHKTRLWFSLLILVSFKVGVNTKPADSSNSNKTLPTAETKLELSVAEKIQNAFKFMMLETPTTTTQKSSPPTSASSSKNDVTTELEYFTMFETTNEPLRGDAKITSKIVTTTSATDPTPMNEQNSTPVTRKDIKKTTEYDYDFITVLSSTFESIEEENQTTTARDRTTDNIGPTTLTGEINNSTPSKRPGGFNFILLKQTTASTTLQQSTTKSVVETTNIPIEATTTRLGDVEETTDNLFMTVYETTLEPPEEVTTAATLTTSKSTVPPLTKTTTKPLTSRKWRTASTTRKATSTELPKTTTKKTKNGDSVYKFKNTGIQFIIKSSTAPVTKRTTLRSNKNQPKTKEPEIWEDFSTTDATNGSIIAGGIIGDGIASVDSPEVPVAVVVPWNGAYFPHPGKFWAKYWYWILIVLLLVIFLFIIPGFFCQVYLSKRCKRRKLDRFFDKRSHIFDFERIGFGRRKTPSTPHDGENVYANVDKGHQSSVFSSSGVSSECARKSSTRSNGNNRSARRKAPLPPDADIHRQPSEEGRPTEHIISGSENATVIFIPNPMEEAGVKILPGSHTESESRPNKLQSFDFPEPVEEDINLPLPRSEIPPSIRSQSDIGLDIGNEAIIKSNNITNPTPVLPLQPPYRPPKPDHMIPKTGPATAAPENRPCRRAQEQKPKKKKTKKDNRQGDEPTRRREPKDAPSQRRRKTSQKVKDRSRATKKTKPNSKKQPTKPDKKDHVSSTQSLMQAAKSLEDILDAITKLTREYPVPELPELKEKERKPLHKEKLPADTRNENQTQKPTSKNRMDEDRHVPDKEMMRRKEKRTKHWADEQQKIDRSRDKKRKKGEKVSSRKREPSSRRRKKRESKRDMKKEKERKPGGMKAKEEKESKKKVPTLMKEEVTPQDRIKQERRRMRLERDLKKLQRYHNTVTKDEEEKPESVE